MARVVLAMSGGVDSSVAAHLLCAAGHEVIGVFMRHGEPPVETCGTQASAGSALPVVSGRLDHKQGCCSASDAEDARRVADRLDMPFYAIDFQREFSRIVDYFIDEYLAARTPNPCVQCNNWIKFGRLFDYADSVGAEFVATGHYARLIAGLGGDGGPGLCRGVDEGKDQSYVLFGIDRRLLGRMLLPVGGYQKADIRRLAGELGLGVADKPDSQEICFVTSGHHAEFIHARRGESAEGDVVTTDGQVVGRHDGLERFTIGQRKGLGIALGEPRFVVRLERDTRRVVLGGRRGPGPGRVDRRPCKLAGRSAGRRAALARSKSAIMPGLWRAASGCSQGGGWASSSTSPNTPSRRARRSSVTTAPKCSAAAGSNNLGALPGTARRSNRGRLANMNRIWPLLMGQALGPNPESMPWWIVAAIGILVMVILMFAVAVIAYGRLWFQAYMSNAHISLSSLIGMSLRQVDSRVIMQRQDHGHAGRLWRSGITTRRLEAHYLAGGNVPGVIAAIIAAHRADIDLDFDRAAAIDLAGRDVLEAVRTSVNPKVIDCPDPVKSKKSNLSAVAKNGVELKIRARVTVRTNLAQLIGGATEETIIARVGEGIITSIGSSESHLEVMENPHNISKAVLDRGLDAHTAFEIVSIDIADIDVGENIGARLQADQAEADTRVARAKAEERRANAIAREQEMKARVAENRAQVILAEADVPMAMAEAFRSGHFFTVPAEAEAGNGKAS